MKLTQKVADSIILQMGKSEHIEWDNDVGGFGLRVRAAGSKRWIFQYDLGKRTRRVTIGNATAMSATRAREVAVEMHSLHRLGRDPAGEKIEGRARAAETMAAALQNYLAYQRGH